MDGYLLDTSTLSALFDSRHRKHADTATALGALDPNAPKYVSVVALAELTFGRRLFETIRGSSPPHLASIIQRAQSQKLLDVTRHTSAEYGELKTKLAKTYLAKVLRRDRSRWLEDWVDKGTGQKLQIDENDLWMCAQARERNLVLVTADTNMVQRISKADPSVRFHIV